MYGGKQMYRGNLKVYAGDMDWDLIHSYIGSGHVGVGKCANSRGR